MKKNPLILIFLATAALGFASLFLSSSALLSPETRDAQTVLAAPLAEDSSPAPAKKWQPLFRGVDYAAAESSVPGPLRIHVVRVDLTAPGIEFIVTPSNGDRPLDTDGLKTSTFLKNQKCQVAINASPFDPVQTAEGEPKDILGLSVSRGEEYSPGAGQFGALLISKDNKARIARPPFDLSEVQNAVGGFSVVLEHGRNVGNDDTPHPRTAVGISEDGRYLYMLVIDGRQKGYSEGVTTAETAEWLKKFGAWDGLNLDGGGSSALVISDGKGGARALNRPINLGIPGQERVNGNSLGVYAKPLPAKQK